MPIFTEARVRDSYLEDIQSPLSDNVSVAAEGAALANPLNSLNRMSELDVATHGGVTLDERSVDPLGAGPFTAGPLTTPPDSPLMSADKARERIKTEGLDLKVPDDGIPERALDILIKRKREERVRQDVLNRGPAGFIPGSLKIGAALGTSLLDPINIASAFIPVIGPARYAALLERAGGIIGRTGVRAAVGAAEGTLGAALLEPLAYAAFSQEQADYTFADSLQNIALGGVLGGGLHIVGGAALDLARRGRTRVPATALESTTVPEGSLSRILDDAAPETREMLLRASLGQVLEGKAVDIEYVAKLDPTIRAAYDGRFDQNTGTRATVASSLETAAETAAAIAPQPAPVVGYTTAKGSTYTVHEDGTTTRDKSYHPEHGAADQGIQPRSDKTFYVTEEDAIKLGEFQTRGASKAVEPVGDGRWGVKYRDGPNAGKFEKRTVVAPKDTPEPGLIPVEVWQGGEKVHFGNKITGVRTAPIVDPAMATREAREAPIPPQTWGEFTSNAKLGVYQPSALADAPASRQADEIVKAAPVHAEAAATQVEQEAAEAVAEVEALARAIEGEESATIAALRTEDMTKDADLLGKAAQAMAACQLRRGI